MLYMLAASADDALTRMKTNSKLLSLTASQSKWDNAGALKQYGWTETKKPVNWAYMGVNDVMKDLGIDTANKANSNIQLVQDKAVEIDGKEFVVSLTGEIYGEERAVCSRATPLTPGTGFQRNLRPGHQRRSRSCDPLLHLLAPPRSAGQQHQGRSRPVCPVLGRSVPRVLQALQSC